jgi:hypothetical protein
MLAKLNSGRRAHVEPSRMRAPSSVLTRAAEVQAKRRLSPVLLNHSYRTYAFGAALGALGELEFDREVLFAAVLRTEAALVPGGRVKFLRSYAAFDLAIKLAPFRGKRPRGAARRLINPGQSAGASTQPHAHAGQHHNTTAPS